MIRRVMGLLGRLMPGGPQGENARAVAVVRRLGHAADWLKGGPLRRKLGAILGHRAWPVAPGAYAVGDPRAAVAVCCLTSGELIQPLARLPGVAIAGRVHTPNLGIEKIVLNVTANPAIRFLLLCGKESAIFHPGQALTSLFQNGVDGSRRIIAAVGHLPVLGNVPPRRIENFRRQVELVDCTGELDVSRLAAAVRDLSTRDVEPFEAPDVGPANASQDRELPHEDESRRLAIIRPGGKREPLDYDPKGFFVIDVDRARREIVCRHFNADNTPAHEMCGRSAETMLLGLLREGLISQLSHAGYLGGEFAKAETALRLGLHFEQDRPLRKGEA
jgi:tetrahydromethanopterin S-methyltransferase subunit A